MTYLYEELKVPTRLYIKQCSHCRLKYFGKTSRKEIEKYIGSGKRWKNHLKKYNANSMHLWNSDWYYDTSISRFALKFSKMNKIVESKNWANLKVEDGLEGGWDNIVWDNERRMNKSLQRKNMNTLVDKDGNTFFGYMTEIDYINVFPTRYNKVYVRDINGNEFTVEKNDKRFQTGEIFGLNKGKKGLADHLNKRNEICIYCGFVSTKGNIVRWHNENCKEKPNE
jgi:hypothetical protein